MLLTGVAALAVEGVSIGMGPGRMARGASSRITWGEMGPASRAPFNNSAPRGGGGGAPPPSPPTEKVGPNFLPGIG